MSQEKIWFITGVSGGLGRSIAKHAALTGATVIGTLRKKEQIDDFSQLVPGKTYGVLLDVNEHADIKGVIDTAVLNFGRIDVLVNNAGYGLFGAVEEVSMEEARQQMETNFFGALAVTQAVLPLMRKQQGGHIVQISSQAGFRSAPGLGIYNASKFALEGFSEALALEAANLNIKVTIVEPGPFRTSWAGDSSKRAAEVIEDYSDVAGKLITTINSYSGDQPNDPEKGAKVIVEVVNSENPPLRLPLGPEAHEAIKNKLKSVAEDISHWESKAIKTGFAD
ncbi:oxidoreductase [Desertivirga brevis]|uniref:oxidoreductase n=1 Tax=Desertivirga brevis TaxID=2810310 RepID=UPI001A96C623|nr:oxidoreductase [Pedobacter sp. SYSU D00873]